jgi:hypothetical protein
VKQEALERFEPGFHRSGDIQSSPVLINGLISSTYINNGAAINLTTVAVFVILDCTQNSIFFTVKKIRKIIFKILSLQK